MTVKHWVSCTRFTVLVETDERGVIVGGAPIVRRFIGQPLHALLKWARYLGGFRHELL
jgi:hypothetical protein